MCKFVRFVWSRPFFGFQSYSRVLQTALPECECLNEMSCSRCCSGFLPAVPFARTDLFFSLPVLTRVIKLEMFWVLSIWLLIKSQMSHVYHKIFPDDKTKYPFTNNFKKVPSTSTQVQHSRHRFAPTHTENGQLKISHASMHRYNLSRL